MLPVALAAWVGSGLTASEHLRRMFRVRVYVLAMSTRMLMLLQLLAVLSLMANYCVGLRDYPREVAGWILAPATLTMTASTFLTTWFHRRALRHFWLLVGVVGCAACLWWMSVRGQLHEQRTSRLDDRLLGAVRRAVPSCLPARRGGGAGPPRFALWRGAWRSSSSSFPWSSSRA